MGGRYQKKGHFFSSNPYTIEIIRILTPPLYLDKNFFHQKFIVERLSAVRLAKKADCSKTTIVKYLRHYNIRKNTPNGKSPYNLALGENLVRGKVVEHKKEQRTLKAIIKMHTEEGLSATAIARVLNTMKIPTKKRGKRWHNFTVTGILQKERVYSCLRILLNG